MCARPVCENLNHDALLETTHEAALRLVNSWIPFNYELTSYFVHLHELGWTPVFILDEFDDARNLFREYPQAFQAIRGLADRPDSRVCFVAISRRALFEIERQADPNSSILSGIFHKISLSCFTSPEVSQLMSRLDRIQLSPTPRLFEFLRENCGGHPYLTCSFAFQLAAIWMSRGLEDCVGALLSARGEFLEHYDELVELLKEDESLHTLLEVIFGPVMTATSTDAAKFEQTGLVRQSLDGGYDGFSRDFTDYLRSIHRSVDLWPLWNQAERTLRDLVSAKMSEIYSGNDWPQRVASERPRLAKTIAEWMELRDRENGSPWAAAPPISSSTTRFLASCGNS